MDMGIGSVSVKQICLAVWDLAKAEKYWTGILGIEAKHLTTPKWEDVPTYSYGKPDTFARQDFIIYELANGVVMEIFGPGEKDNPTPWREFLEKHGEGLCNLAFYVPDLEGAYKSLGELCQAKGPYHEGFYPTSTYSFYDTYPEIGMELNIKRDQDNTALIAGLKADPLSFEKRDI